MFSWFRQSQPNEDEERPALLSELFARIQEVRVRDEYKKRRKYLSPSVYLILASVCLPFLMGFANHVYNRLCGPFHMDISQFTTHLINFNENLNNPNAFRAGLWPFQQEYFQVELGEDQIRGESNRILREYAYDNSHFKSSYTMKAAQNNEIYQALSPNKFYVKFAARGQNHFHSRRPYRFQLFTIETLACIVRQLNVLPATYRRWHDKATFIEQIEAIYGRNSTAFNTKVLTKCGILIGYLYRPKGSRVYMPGWVHPYSFNKGDIALDIASSYFPYKTYLCCFGFLCACIFGPALTNWMIYLYQKYQTQTLSLLPELKGQLRTLKLDSLQSLEEAIKHTPISRRYMNGIFLLRNQYLVIFKISLGECKSRHLRRFYGRSSFTVVRVRTIQMISHLGTTISHTLSPSFIPFPSLYRSVGDDVTHWLHGILMDISVNYQRRYILFFDNVLCTASVLFRFSYYEEELTLGRRLLNDTNGHVQETNNMTAASLRFIDAFRAAPRRTVQENDHDLRETKCTVYQYPFESGQAYAQWPCTAQHCFHHDCMLELLNSSHVCPPCRHAVEATNVL